MVMIGLLVSVNKEPDKDEKQPLMSQSGFMVEKMSCQDQQLWVL
jgi:hypothetical protein